MTDYNVPTYLDPQASTLDRVRDAVDRSAKGDTEAAAWVRGMTVGNAPKAQAPSFRDQSASIPDRIADALDRRAKGDVEAAAWIREAEAASPPPVTGPAVSFMSAQDGYRVTRAEYLERMKSLPPEAAAELARKIMAGSVVIR